VQEAGAAAAELEAVDAAADYSALLAVVAAVAAGNYFHGVLFSSSRAAASASPASPDSSC
jgi:hypothetical protein